jgi:RHS repeat-associated protein
MNLNPKIKSRLSTLIQGSDVYGFEYNGLGDRLSQTVNDMTTNYTLDLNSGLTQVLNDGHYDYLYGVNRIAQKVTPYLTEYYLTDALGSVRQVASSAGEVTLSKRYDPYGQVLDYEGSSNPSFGYAGEMQDSTGMVYLRARYYAPYLNQFISKDTFRGYITQPGTLNLFAYVNNNPVRYRDPSGNKPCDTIECQEKYEVVDPIQIHYGEDWYGEWDLEQQKINSAIVENVLTNAIEFEMGFIAPSLVPVVKIINDDEVNGFDFAFAVIPVAGNAAKGLGSIGEEVTCAASKADDVLNATEVGAGSTIQEAAEQIVRKARNPWGKLGGPKHQAIVTTIIDKAKELNFEVHKEYKISGILNGYKDTRYADVYINSGETEWIIQVGKVTKNGMPVLRERKVSSSQKLYQ